MTSKTAKTSLHKRSKLTFTALLVLWTALFGTLLIKFEQDHKDQLRSLAEQQAIASIEKDLSFRAWNSRLGGVYAPVTEDSRPNEFIADEDRKFAQTKDGTILTLINPDYMTRMAREIHGQRTGTWVKLICFDARHKESVPKDWEVTALRKSVESGEPYSEIVTAHSQPYLRYVKPVEVERSCLTCHSGEGYQAGETMGGLAVAVPLAGIQATLMPEITNSRVSLGVIWLVGLAAFLFSYTQIRSKIIQQSELQQKLESSNRNLRQLTGELERKNKEWQAFSYAVSHDLQSPIRQVGQFSRLLVNLVKEGAHPDEIDEIAQSLISSSTSMKNIVHSLLQLSRANSNQLNKEHGNLSRLLEEIIDSNRPEVELIECEVEVEQNLLAEYDPTLMKIALENLFNNALKYAGKERKPSISFSAMGGNGSTIYCLKDNGIGFDQEEASRMFEPFVRLSNVDGYHGCGIGLSTVSRIIERHGGSVWAEGRLGEGTSIYFTLGNGSDGDQLDQHPLNI